MREQRFKVGDKNVWANADKAPEKRAIMKYLLGLKHILVEQVQWGYTKADVKVEEITGTMVVGNATVLAVTMQGGVLRTTWLVEEWAEWKELHNSGALLQLTEKCNGLAGKSKGVGKGSYGSTK